MDTLLRLPRIPTYQCRRSLRLLIWCLMSLGLYMMLYTVPLICTSRNIQVSARARENICKLIDCKKLLVDACMHAVQNERLPMRVVVQVLFFEQVRISATSGCSTLNLPKSIRDLNNGSRRSSRSAATNPDEDWDTLAIAEELKALKTEVVSLRLRNGVGSRSSSSNNMDRGGSYRVKGLLKSKKVFAKLWSSKGGKAHKKVMPNYHPHNALKVDIQCKVEAKKKFELTTKLKSSRDLT